MSRKDLEYRELRADWLKLRGYLHDPNTQLPSLPAVIDEVRRRLEGGDQVGLIYLNLGGDGHSEAVYGWQEYDQLIRHVAAAIERCRNSVLAANDVVALLGVRSDEFLIFADIGADQSQPSFLSDLERRLLSRLSLELKPLLQGEGQHNMVVQSAGIQVTYDPTLRIERSIYSALTEAKEICRRENERRHSGRTAELRRILTSGDISIRYQPILSLSDGAVLAYEALSSAPTGVIFETPEILFSFAEESELIVQLERLCRRNAIRRAADLVAESGEKIFINCSAPAFGDPQLAGDLIRGAEELGVSPSNLVVEVTERVAITEWRVFRRVLRALRRSGLQVAIDDMGSGYSSLHAVAEIEPEYLKLDLSLIRRAHESPIKRDLIGTMVHLAQRIGAQTIAEGIETVEEFETVQNLGVDFGQGFFFARPRLPLEAGEINFPRPTEAPLDPGKSRPITM